MASLILASASPRRKELLGHLGVSFDIRAADIDESVQTGEPPRAYVERLARSKALTIATREPQAHVVAADTSAADLPNVDFIARRVFAKYRSGNNRRNANDGGSYRSFGR